MKRCPACTARFPDSFAFCERDGTALVADFSSNYSETSQPGTPEKVEDFNEIIEETSPQAASVGTVESQRIVRTSQYPVSADARLRQNLKLLTVMVVGGFVIGLVLLLVYRLMRADSPNENANTQIATGALKQQPIPAVPLRPSTPDAELASPEPSPSPSASPSPSPQLESAPLAVSSGMVSTGGDEKSGRGPFTIHLTNGNNVEADDVWQTQDGIWYRRHGVATLLERNEVKAIERIEEKKSSAAASPAPTPSSSRAVSP